MNHGGIEQVGTPLEIYRQPATAYVANFVGTMNFLPAIALSGDRVRLGERIELSCSNGAGQLSAGSKVTLCVRPEDVLVRDVAEGTPNSFRARIDDMEFLGSFYRARLTLGAAPEFTADFSINAVRDLGLKPQNVLNVAFPADRLRVFQKRSEA
jgi:iron(III) transport system ATP-binding protein